MNIKKKLRPIIFVGLLIVFAFTMIVPVNVTAMPVVPGIRLDGGGPFAICGCPWPWEANCGCVQLPPQ